MNELLPWIVQEGISLGVRLGKSYLAERRKRGLRRRMHDVYPELLAGMMKTRPVHEVDRWSREYWRVYGEI